jgi:hypothetical protein
MEAVIHIAFAVVTVVLTVALVYGVSKTRVQRLPHWLRALIYGGFFMAGVVLIGSLAMRVADKIEPPAESTAATPTPKPSAPDKADQ